MKPQNPFQLSQTLAHNLLRESNYSGVLRTLAGECHMRTLGELDQSDPLFHSLRRIGIVSTAGGKLGGALRTVGGALSEVISGGLKAAGVFQTISLANAVEDVKRLDLATAKLGQSAGVSGTLLRDGFDKVEKKTLTSSVAMADLSRQLGRVTYDGKFAAGSIATLGDEALAVGRDLGDELPLAAALRDMGVTAERLPAELGRIRDMAEQVATVGGHLALKDQIAALQPLLSGVATESDAARARLEALVAVLGKGLKPEQAKQVGAAALQQLRSRALDIERVTGRRVIDDKGQLVDPTQSLADLKRLADKRHGNNQEAKRRALMADFGQELGLAIMRTDFNEVDQTSKTSVVKPSIEKQLIGLLRTLIDQLSQLNATLPAISEATQSAS